MKKLLTIFITLLVLSCSSSDDSSSNNNAFHPPLWIQGTWSFDEQFVNGFVFTNNTFCSINGTQENCFLSQESDEYQVDENISNTEYEFTIRTLFQGQVLTSNSYRFIYEDETHIYFDDPIVGNRLMYKL